MPLERQAVNPADCGKTSHRTVANCHLDRLAGSDDLVDIEITIVHRCQGVECGKGNTYRIALGQLLLAADEDTHDLGGAGKSGIGDEQLAETASSVTNCLHHNRSTNGGWDGGSIKRIEQGDVTK